MKDFCIHTSLRCSWWDAALGPKCNYQQHKGHQAAISIDFILSGQRYTDRPDPNTNLYSTKWDSRWSYDNGIVIDERYLVPQADKSITLNNIKGSRIGF